MNAWLAVLAVSLLLIVLPTVGLGAESASPVGQVSRGEPTPTVTATSRPSTPTPPLADAVNLGSEPPQQFGSPKARDDAPLVAPRGTGDDAQAVNPPPHVILAPGQSQVFTITFRNVGTTTWTAAAGYAMWHVPSGTSYSLGQGFGDAGGCNGLLPSQACSWSFRATASDYPGYYDHPYRMYHNGAGFGDTIVFSFTVPGPSPSPTATTTPQRPEAIVWGITRNADPSYSVVRPVTNEIRLTNTGAQRTIARIAWYVTNSNDLPTLARIEELDLAAGSSTVLGPSAIPNGCTRCMLVVVSVDVDGGGPTYGLSTIEATLTERVVEASQTTVTTSLPRILQLFPQGLDTPNAWEIPAVHKQAAIGGHQWNTILLACLLPGVQAPRQLEAQLLASGQPPFVITQLLNPGGCNMLNLAAPYPADAYSGSQIATLPNGTYTARLTGLGGFFVSALSYSVTAPAVTWTNSTVAPPATPLATRTGSPVIPTNTPIVRTPTPTLVNPFDPRRLEAVVAGISRNPDTTYTGVDVETVELRVQNLGSQRTLVSVEWLSTDSDEIASLIHVDSVEVAAGSDPDPIQSTAIFPRAVIPDGCTRCQAHIYSYDLDGSGPLDAITDLQASVTQRVVGAGNATASAPVPLIEEVIPSGPDAARAWLLPAVYKQANLGGQIWDSLITVCMVRTVSAPRGVEVQFLAPGQPPYAVTRFVNPGGCLTLNLAAPDPKDPNYANQIALLPNGTYAVRVNSIGGVYANVLSYTVGGQAASLTNGVPTSLATPLPTPTGATAVPTATLRTRTPTPTPGCCYSRSLEAAIPGIARNPDTGVLGLDLETVDVQVSNRGRARTLAQIEWYATASDNVVTLVKTDGLEIAGTDDPDPAHRLAIFSRALVPDGCTRCLALVYSLDNDGASSAQQLVPLDVTTSTRVVNAGNAVGTTAVPAYSRLFPFGTNTPDSWVFPQVFKNAPSTVPTQNTLLNGCLLTGVGGPRLITFTFSPVSGNGAATFTTTRTVSPGGCLALNLNTLPMPNGAYSLTITDAGGFVVHALTYSIAAQTAQLTSAGLPAVAGHDFAVRSGPPGAAYAMWQAGWAQTGSLIIRWSPVAGPTFFPANLAPFPPQTTSFTDPGPLVEEVYCYLLMAVGGEPASLTNFLGFSDFVCLANGPTGNPPGNVTVRLSESDTAVVTWTPPSGGGQPTYRVTARKFTGAPDEVFTHGADVQGVSHNTQGDATCYAVAAVTNGTVIGIGREVCAVPRIASFTAATGLTPAAVLERAGRALERPPRP